MKNIIYVYYIIIALVVPNLMRAQAEDVLPPSPENAALAKFIEQPISLFSGQPEINIPLYTVIDGNIKIPISISYHSSGIKVNEDASWVGLGWCLNAAGKIIRDQRGESDWSGNGYAHAEWLPSGNWNFDNAHIEQLTEQYCDFYSNEPDNRTNVGCLEWTEWDGEPDMYFFNFCGYNGKFMIYRKVNSGNVSKEYQVLDRQPIRFHNSGGKFMAFTPDGLRYEFMEGEDTGLSTGSTSTMVDGIMDAFSLTKIAYANRSVTFEYTPKDYFDGMPFVTYCKADLDNTIGDRNDYGTSRYSYTYGSFLQYIRFGNGYVKFISSNRDDVPGGKKLDRIEVFTNGNNTPVKAIDFNYSYFEGSEDYGNFYKSGNVSGDINTSLFSDEVLSKRLKLESIYINGELYTFQYNEDQKLPYKTSLSMDYWGYFNGVKTNKTLLPTANYLKKYYNIPSNFDFYTGANREPQESYLKAGILKSITYPTGGTTSYDYEINTFENRKNSYYSTYETISITDCINSKYDNKEYIYDNNTTQSIKLSITIYSPGVNKRGESYVRIEEFDEESNAWIVNSSNEWDLYYYNYDCTHGDSNDGCSCVENCGGTLEDDFYALFLRDINITLAPGKYRFIAKYPLDNGESGEGRYQAGMNFTLPVQKKIGFLKGGGLRIKNITHECSGQPTITKSYNYEGGYCYQMPYFTKVYDMYSNLSTCQIVPSTFLIPANYHSTGLSAKGACLYSGTLLNYSNSANGSIVGYKKVVEHSNNDEIGKTEYIYSVGNGIDAYRDVTLPGIPANNFLNIGLLEQKNIYKYDIKLNALSQVKKITNTYEPFDKLLGWGYKKEYEPVLLSGPGGTIPPLLKVCGSLRLHMYPIRFSAYKLTKKIESEYDNNGQEISSTTTYGYNEKGFENYVKNISSSGKISEIKKVYPYEIDYGGWWSIMGGINLIQYPIEVIKEVDEEVIEGTYICYESTNGYYFPKEKYNLEKKDGVNFISIKDNNGIKSDLFYRVHNITYNNDGNISSSKKEDDILTSYYWGNDRTYIEATFENYSYDDLISNTNLTSLLNELENFNDLSTEILHNSLVVLNNNIRKQIPNNVTVRTFTYSPLIGMTSQTDPNGRTTYYEYDDFGRLEFIRDQDYNIVKMYDYHYVNDLTEEGGDSSTDTGDSDDSTDDTTNGGDSSDSTSSTATLNIAEEILTIDAFDSYVVKVDSNTSWTASTTDGWLKIISKYDDSFTILVDDCSFYNSCSGKVTVTTDDNTEIHEITIRSKTARER